MLSSSLDTLLKVSKTTSPQKRFAYDCETLYIHYVTVRMDISDGTVPADPILTGGMDPGMNTKILTECTKSKYVRFSIRNIYFLYSSLKHAK